MKLSPALLVRSARWKKVETLLPTIINKFQLSVCIPFWDFQLNHTSTLSQIQGFSKVFLFYPSRSEERWLRSKGAEWEVCPFASLAPMTLGEEKQRALHSCTVTPRDQWKTKPIRSFRPYMRSLFWTRSFLGMESSAMKPSRGCGMYSFFVVPASLPRSMFWNDLIPLICSKWFPFHQFFVHCSGAVPMPNPVWASCTQNHLCNSTDITLRVFDNRFSRDEQI